MQKKAYLIMFLVLALALSGWAVSPALGSAAQPGPELKTSDCKSGVDALVGNLAAMTEVTDRARQICEFNIRMDDLDKELSDPDRRYIESAIAGNMVAIESLQFARDQVQTEEWRALIDMMIAMHTHDLEMALAVAEKFNLDTTPDLTNVPVYPGTPDFDLGMRQVDLQARFLNPLMSAGGGIPPTVTALPTDLTGTPMDVTDTPTAVPTSTIDLTGTTVVSTTDTTTPTADLEATPTAALTDTATPTVDLNGTATSIPTTDTTTPTVDLTGTTTALPTSETGTPTAVPTFIPTIPTIPGGAMANFDLVSLMIIEDEQAMLVETALAAQRLAQNDEIRAFAKHAADMAQLHLLLMNDLQYRILGLVVLPPPPEFQKDYQGPRRFESVGDVTSK